jgi:hypothetical protein
MPDACGAPLPGRRDAAEGRAPMPGAARTLGLQFIDANVEDGTIAGEWPEWPTPELEADAAHDRAG